LQTDYVNRLAESKAVFFACSHTQIPIYRSVSYNAFVGAGFFPPETQLEENVPNSGKIRPSRSDFTDGRVKTLPYDLNISNKQ